MRWLPPIFSDDGRLIWIERCANHMVRLTGALTPTDAMDLAATLYEVREAGDTDPERAASRLFDPTLAAP